MTNSPQTETTLTHEQNTCLFEDTIDPRLDESEELNSAQIGELLNRLGHRRQHNEKLLGDILQEVGNARQIVDTCCARRFDTIVKKMAPRNSTGWFRAEVEWRYTNEAHYHDSYKTLSVIGSNSFVKWPLVGTDGKTVFKILSRYYFYPALITENMRMFFARATKKQITYMRDRSEPNDIKFIGKTPFKTSVYFPKENTQHRNIVITLERFSGGETCNLEFLFDGEQFHVVNILSTAPFYDNGFDTLIKTELINSPKALNDFLRHCLKPFRCNELGIYYKNLEEYLGDRTYKVGRTEAVGTHIYIVHRNNKTL